MDEAIDIVFGDSVSYTLSPFHVYIFESEIPVSLSMASTGFPEQRTWWDSPGRSNCRLRPNGARSLQVRAYSSDHIPTSIINSGAEWAWSNSKPTMNTTRPRSPVTFRCLFAISSRKGTTTVHPLDARICQYAVRFIYQCKPYPIAVQCIVLRTRSLRILWLYVHLRQTLDILNMRILHLVCIVDPPAALYPDDWPSRAGDGDILKPSLDLL